MAEMQYRRLGASGLKVGALSLGSYVTYANQVDLDAACEMMAAAFGAGVNFFDNAEAYSGGRSESLMGAVFKRLGWPRLQYVVSTKLYWGLDRHGGINGTRTLNRKYLMQGIDGSLRRLGLDFVDLVFCHRPDPGTPLEETVWAMSDMVRAGKALYWGTSEWSAADIAAAWSIAERHHLHKPVMEQPEYNLFHRARVEREYAPLYASIGLGLTTWSPLAMGLLTGKYRDGVPPDSRGAVKNMGFLIERLTDNAKNDAVAGLQGVAGDAGCSLAQLALAWTLCNQHVSTVIMGTSRLAQLHENLGALAVVERLDPALLSRIDAICTPLAD